MVDNKDVAAARMLIERLENLRLQSTHGRSKEVTTGALQAALATLMVLAEHPGADPARVGGRLDAWPMTYDWSYAPAE